MTTWTRVAANDSAVCLLKVRTNIPASLWAFDITSEMKVTMQRYCSGLLAIDAEQSIPTMKNPPNNFEIDVTE